MLQGKAFALFEGIIWSGDRRQALGMRNQMRRLLFVLDDRDWAFDNIRKEIAPSLVGQWETQAIYTHETPDLADIVVAMAAGYDHVHVFWQPLIDSLFDAQTVGRAARKLSTTAPELIERLARPTLTSTIYDHMGLVEGRAERFSRIAHVCDRYGVASPILADIYRARADYPQSFDVLPDGVNVARYAAARTREPRQNAALRVGWVGDSRSGLNEGVRDLKGVESVLRPALAYLEVLGVPIEPVLIDRRERWRSREEVIEAYGEMDVLVCASLHEGTPNPVLEAMAAGLAIVSTDVGIVRMVLPPEQLPFIVARTPEAVAIALQKLAADPALAFALGERNRVAIAAHDWSARGQLWLEFFARAQEQAASLSVRARQERLSAFVQDGPRGVVGRVRSLLRADPRLYRFAAALHHRWRRWIAR